eukprot:11531419-Alexandrium_andersonii.AAC.1
MVPPPLPRGKSAAPPAVAAKEAPPRRASSAHAWLGPDVSLLGGAPAQPPPPPAPLEHATAKALNKALGTFKPPPREASASRAAAPKGPFE